MGKKQHSKDPSHLTATEWKGLGGFKKANETTKLEGELPFECCALTLLPFSTPACTLDGVLFDLVAILEFVKAHGTNPVTGAPLNAKDVVRLKMERSPDGNKWQCPVTKKVFTRHTKVAAVRTTGNVYAYEALKTLCFATKATDDATVFVDLVDGATPFKRSDVIVVHDPEDLALRKRRDLSNFQHLKDERAKVLKLAAPGVRGDASGERARILQEAKRSVADAASKSDAKRRRRAAIEADPAHPKNKGLTETYLRVRALNPTTEDVLAGHRVTSGDTSRSTTSTARDVSTSSQLRAATDAELCTARWKVLRSLKKKGYARLDTSFGPVNLEIRCDVAPVASENFLGLCRTGYYDGCVFHRVVPGFVAQTGDPTGEGDGGDSLWGGSGKSKKKGSSSSSSSTSAGSLSSSFLSAEDDDGDEDVSRGHDGGSGVIKADGRFADEFDSRLRHDARGVLAMANTGRDTNRSQFYLTFAPCPHLDNKHTVFGRVVGGLATLDAIERVRVDASDDHRPTADVTILTATVFVDPVPEADALFETQVRDAIAKRTAAASSSRRPLASAPRPSASSSSSVSSAVVAATKKTSPSAGAASSSGGASGGHTTATVGKYLQLKKRPWS